MLTQAIFLLMIVATPIGDGPKFNQESRTIGSGKLSYNLMFY